MIHDTVSNGRKRFESETSAPFLPSSSSVVFVVEGIEPRSSSIEISIVAAPDNAEIEVGFHVPWGRRLPMIGKIVSSGRQRHDGANDEVVSFVIPLPRGAIESI